MNNTKKILFTILILFSIASVKAMNPSKVPNDLLIEQTDHSNSKANNKNNKLKNDERSDDEDSDEFDDKSESFLQQVKENNVSISAGVAGAGILGAALNERVRNSYSYYAGILKDSVTENIVQPLKNKLGVTKNKLLGGMAILGSGIGLKKLNEKFGLKNSTENLRAAYNDLYDKSCELSKNRKVQIGVGGTALVGGATLTYLWLKNRSVTSENKSSEEIEKSLEDLELDNLIDNVNEEEKERENLSEAEIKEVKAEDDFMVETSLEELDAHELAVELGNSISKQLHIPGMSEFYECMVMNPASLADIDETEVNRLLNDSQKVLLSLLIKKSENINNN